MTTPLHPVRLKGTSRNPGGDPRARRNQQASSVHVEYIGNGLTIAQDGTIVVSTAQFVPYVGAVGDVHLGSHKIYFEALTGPPFFVSSSVVVAGLNAALLDGHPASDFLMAATLALSSLVDVAITGPTNGQVLTFDSGLGKWKNAPSSGGGGNTHYEPICFADEVLIFNHDVVMLEVPN